MKVQVLAGRRFLSAVVVGLVLSLTALTGVLWPVGAHAQDAGGDYVEGQVVVKIDPQSGATIGQINADYGTEVERPLLENCSTCAKIYLLRITDGVATEQKAERMSEDQRLSYAEPNIITDAPEGDPRMRARDDGVPTPYSDPGPYSNQYAVGALNLPEAHSLGRGRGAVVAVLDTGVELGHTELGGSLTAARYDFVDDDATPGDAPDGADNDGDGETDEQVGHGTHVAGIVHLTAPEARIMPLRVLDSDGVGNAFLIAEAVQYAVRNGADVINLSLGSRRESELLEDIVEDLEAEEDDDDGEDEVADDDALVGVPPEGVVVVGAAGNEGSSTERYPAAEEGAIAVASVDEREKKSGFSNYDAAAYPQGWIDVSAPGEKIYSLFPKDRYATWSGTSMATPFVAGQAALIRGMRPRMPSTADGPRRPSVEGTIEGTARSLDAKNPGYSGRLGAGHADAYAALRSLNAAPTVSALNPRPGARIKSRRPAIRATVRDAETNLAKSHIRLFVDGKRKSAFGYDRSTDRLSYRSGRLAYARHTVKIVATDPHGKRTVKTWRFRVVR